MGFFDKLKKINIFASFGSELTDDTGGYCDRKELVVF